MSHEPIGVVLCAGHGTRLRPVTERIPKPAVPFLGRPIAWYALRMLREAGVSAAGVNLHHLPDAMRGALEANPIEGLSVQLRAEPELLGTAGGLRGLWAEMGRDRPVVLVHGDTLLRLDLRMALAAHRASGAPATLVLKLRDPDEALRNVFLDETGEIAGLFEHRRPEVIGRLRELAFTGVHILEPEVFDWLPERGFSCLVSEVYTRKLVEGARLNPVLTTGFYADLGTYERFLEAQAAVLAEPARLPQLDWPPARALGVHVDPRAVIAESAELIAPVRIDGPVEIGPGARIGPDVVLSGALRVAAQTRCARCAVWGEGHLEGTIEDTLRSLP